MTIKELQQAARKMSYRGYIILGSGVWYVENDDPDSFESRYVCEMLDDLTETLQALEAAGWPTHEGEIPCVECGRFVPSLGSYCDLCAISEAGDLAHDIRSNK